MQYNLRAHIFMHDDIYSIYTKMYSPHKDLRSLHKLPMKYETINGYLGDAMSRNIMMAYRHLTEQLFPLIQKFHMNQDGSIGKII